MELQHHVCSDIANARRSYIPPHRVTSSLLKLTLALLLPCGGCLSSHQASQSTLPPPPDKSQMQATPASTRPDGMDASDVNPAELVAQRARQYSQEMAPAIARASTPATSSPSMPIQPSLVQWQDPSSSQLSLLPSYLLRPDGAAPASAAVEAAPTAANQPIEPLASIRPPQAHAGTSSDAGSLGSVAPARDADKAQLASMTQPPKPTEVMQGPPSDAQSQSSAPVDNPGAETLSALSDRLAKRVQDYPHDVSAQFDYQVLRFMMDQPVPDLSTIASLPDEDREMLSAVMDGMSMYRNNLRADNNMLMSRKVQPLLDMAGRLRALADLTIPTLALCQEVKGFGNYTPFEGDPPRFSAGVAHPVILYAEVQNFLSQLNTSKMWETQLSQDAVLYTEEGMPVWTDKTRSVTDTARERRQDFFIVQRIDLPATLPMGRYLLKVTIQDQQSHHVAESTQPLVIAE